MLVTSQQLKAIYKEAPASRIDMFIVPINETLQKYQINTPQRIRMFLAQIGHESGQLRYVEELATGAAYEGRTDLGNSNTGDGVKYKGRGLLQITGRTNYETCSRDLQLPLLEKPTLLAQVPYAALSAGWYWNKNKLNSLCDSNNFEKLTRRINGGLNGYADRLKLLKRAEAVIL